MQNLSLKKKNQCIYISSKKNTIRINAVYITIQYQITGTTCCGVRELSLFLLNTRISDPRQGATYMNLYIRK